MSARSIGVGVHYRSLAGYSFYGDRFGWRKEDYPHAARIGDQTLSIPLSAKLEEGDIARVIDAVRTIALGATTR